MTNKPTSTTALEPTEIAATQTIIRADNGDVIVADETGLRMFLTTFSVASFDVCGFFVISIS